MDKRKILIIEDEKKAARFLELELTHEGYQVEIAYDGRAGLQKIENNKYDIVLLDIMLPEISGIEVCRRVRQFSSLPIIMLTAKDDVTDRVMGLDIGADDYITKPFAIEELLARIRVALRHENPSVEPVALQAGDLNIIAATREVKRDGVRFELTKKEYDLLEYLVKNKGIVLSREQILNEVWGYDFPGDTNVVDVYIRYLRSKVDDPFPVKLIYTVRGIGYVLREANKNET